MSLECRALRVLLETQHWGVWYIQKALERGFFNIYGSLGGYVAANKNYLAGDGAGQGLVGHFQDFYPGFHLVLDTFSGFHPL